VWGAWQVCVDEWRGAGSRSRKREREMMAWVKARVGAAKEIV